MYSLPIVSKSWYNHHPPPVVETSNAKLLWNFSLATDYTHVANHPFIVLFEYQQQQIYFVEVSCPADINVTSEEDEKISKYTSLVADFHQMYDMPVTIIPVVLGPTGIISSRCLIFSRGFQNFQ